jgi:hypothetical protein
MAKVQLLTVALRLKALEQKEKDLHPHANNVNNTTKITDFFQHLSIQTALIVIPSFLNIKDVNKVSTMCLGKRLGPR